MLVDVVNPAGDADAAGIDVVQVNGGQAGEGGAHHGGGADVAGIAQHEHGDHVAQGGSQGAQTAAQVNLLPGQFFHQFRREFHPVGFGLFVQLGQVDVAKTHVFVSLETDFLVFRHHGADRHFPEVAVNATGRVFAFGLDGFAEIRGQHLDVALFHGVGVVIDVHLAGVGGAAVPIQSVDDVGLALVQVDGLFVDQHRRAVQIHLAQHAVAVAGVDDHEVFRAGRPQRDFLGGIGGAGPEPFIPRMAQDAFFFQVAQDALDFHAAERFAFAEGQFERPAFQVAGEDGEVVGIDQAALGGGAEEIAGMLNNELVERRRTGHQEDHRTFLGAPRAAALLPGGGDGPRVARQHCRLEPADVDAQFQGVGADHAQVAAGARAFLDVAPFVGEIASPVAADTVGILLVALHGALEVGGEDFHAQAAAAEDDGLNALQQELGGDAAGLVDHRLADAQFLIDDRGIVEDEMLFAPGRAVVVDQAEGNAEELLGQFPGIGDGRRAADEAGIRAVEFADPPQAPHQVGEMAAEHAPVMMHLVHHHVLQVFEEPDPQGVMRQDTGMEHVRIGDNDMAGVADGAAGALGRIAVEGVNLDITPHLRGDVPRFQHLVLRQRLGGKEVQRPGFGVDLGEMVQHRQVVTHGLAGGGGGDHDHVFAPQDMIHRRGLVAKQALDASLFQHLPQFGGEAVRPGAVLGRLGGNGMPEGDVIPDVGIGAEGFQYGIDVGHLNPGHNSRC